jgi:hypothetical protein
MIAVKIKESMIPDMGKAFEENAESKEFTRLFKIRMVKSRANVLLYARFEGEYLEK